MGDYIAVPFIGDDHVETNWQYPRTPYLNNEFLTLIIKPGVVASTHGDHKAMIWFNDVGLRRGTPPKCDRFSDSIMITTEMQFSKGKIYCQSDTPIVAPTESAIMVNFRTNATQGGTGSRGFRLNYDMVDDNGYTNFEKTLSCVCGGTSRSLVKKMDEIKKINGNKKGKKKNKDRKAQV